VTDINQDQIHSQPSRITLLFYLAVTLSMAAIVYWAVISTISHIPQIKQAIGL
jgi:hypothetical protein